MHGFYSFWDGPGLRAGVGAADFLHVRHPIPQSRSAPAGGWNPRPRSWPWSWRGAGKSGRHGSMFALSGPEGVRPRPGRVVGESGWGGGVPVCRKPGARVCRIKRVSVCPAVGRAVGCRYGCRPARKRRCGRMPGPPSAGCPACRDMRGSVNRTAPSVCRKGVLVVGTGALPCLLPAKNEGSPERLPSPSKINP